MILERQLTLGIATLQAESVFEAARSDLPEKDAGWMNQANAGRKYARDWKILPCDISVPEKLQPKGQRGSLFQMELKIS